MLELYFSCSASQLISPPNLSPLPPRASRRLRRWPSRCGLRKQSNGTGHYVVHSSYNDRIIWFGRTRLQESYDWMGVQLRGRPTCKIFHVGSHSSKTLCVSYFIGWARAHHGCQPSRPLAADTCIGSPDSCFLVSMHVLGSHKHGSWFQVHVLLARNQDA